jgi:putative salt-induced outer membrane protein
VDDRLYAFGALRYEDDRFSGFDYQSSVALGVGYKFIDTETTKLAGRAGPGFRSLRQEVLIKDASGAVIQRIPGESQSDAVLTAGVDFMHAFNANTKVIDTFLAEAGSSNTSLQNDLALQVKMSEKLALSAGFGVRNNSKPPAGLKELDTTTTLNLVYGF